VLAQGNIAMQAIDPVLMCRSADQACLLIKALSNSDRLVLLCQLINGEKSVAELEAATGIEQPTLSQQLGVLRKSALVNARRGERNSIHYRISSRPATEVLCTIFPGIQHADQ
jgi:DNA-binding transcriptional ArsR family regulator